MRQCLSWRGRLSTLQPGNVPSFRSPLLICRRALEVKVVAPCLLHQSVAQAFSAIQYSTQASKHPLESSNDDDLVSRLASRLPAKFLESVDPNGRPSKSSITDPYSVDNAVELGSMLLKARESSLNDGGSNILYELAVTKGQWKSTVWLIQFLIDKLQLGDLFTDKLSQLVEQDSTGPSLDTLTRRPINSPPVQSRAQQMETKPSLSSFSNWSHSENPSTRERLGHRILGAIWHALGLMTLACVRDRGLSDGKIKPEILEILALLHHHGFMPPSIYTHVPVNQQNALQQPPILHLLSSHIITALTDAAWQAREKTIVEKAKTVGSDDYALRPELPSSSYRVNVGAVKPEIWLELTLWSCLHGGWIADGADVLSAVCSETDNDAWRPVSWRDSVQSLMPFGQINLVDWASIKQTIDTTPASSIDQLEFPALRLERSVSSELVNAFIEALVNSVFAGVSSKGLALEYVVTRLKELDQFLQRSGLYLHGGSWDAIILRLIDSGGASMARSETASDFVSLSPGMGEELRSQHAEALPSYVLDGNAALLGLLHRHLRGQIKASSISGASRALLLIQRVVDDARRRSITDFFESTRLSSESARSGSEALFTSNFSGIEYPVFDPQIPSNIWAALFDLITEAQAFDFGRSLLAHEDVDGITIPETVYADPTVTPSLIRFATAVNDMDLFSNIVRARVDADSPHATNLRPNLLISTLSAQFMMKRWDDAIKIVELLQELYNESWSLSNLATLTKVIIKLTDDAKIGSSSAQADLDRAFLIFRDFVNGGYPAQVSNPLDRAQKLSGLLAVTSVLDTRFAAIFHQSRETQGMTPPTTTQFNTLVEAVAETRGSGAARDFLDTFWPIDKRSGCLFTATDGGSDTKGYAPYRRRTLTPRRTSSFEVVSADGNNFLMREPAKVSFVTIRIILRKALQEQRTRKNRIPSVDVLGNDGAPSATQEWNSCPQTALRWAADCMRTIRSSNRSLAVSDMLEELKYAVTEEGMPELKSHISQLAGTQPSLGKGVGLSENDAWIEQSSKTNST